MTHIRNFIPNNILKTLYNTLILPYLHYGILLWGFDANIRNLKILQKKAIRIVSNVFPLEHTERLFKIQKIMKIQDIFHSKLMVLYYDFKKGNLPNYIRGMFTTPMNNGRYSLRMNNHKLLTETQVTLNSTKDSLRFFLPKFLNERISELSPLFDIESNHTFKYRVKEFFLSKYSLDICADLACYPCNMRLYYPSFLPTFLQYIHPLAYLYS